MRVMLEQAAAAKWGVKHSDVYAQNGIVYQRKSKRQASYGELAKAASALAVPTADQISLKKPDQWRYIGKAQDSGTIPKIVKGEGTFGMDVRLPDMAYAVIAHPPQILAKVASYDDSETLKVPGVIATVKMPDATDPVVFNPLGGVAIIAVDTWAAIQGRNALKVTWQDGPNANYNSDEFEQQIVETASKAGDVRRNRGDVYAALEKSEQRVSADYYVPHLSQSPMEPPVATARWNKKGQVECWASSQTPQRARSVVASVCGVTEQDVTINVTWLGGGFGRKSNPDFVAEAAFIAREAKRPIKLVWTREDDLGLGFTHTVSAQHMEAGLDENGKCSAYLHRIVFPPIGSTFTSGEDNPTWGELRLGASDTPFATPNFRIETGRAKAHVRIGWLRSVSNIYHGFAIQSFVHELAVQAKRDPKDYLLEMIGEPRFVDPIKEGAEYDNYGGSLEEYPIDTARLSNTIETVAKMANWGRSLKKGHGLGIAAHRSFLSYVATVVEVFVKEDGELSIEGVWSVMDAGIVVNTGNAKSQLEGGTIYGLSNALYGEISTKDGIVEQANFPDWRVLRMAESPKHFETKIIQSDAPPGGVGEPPTPPAAPALANAIYAATGKRFRRLPIIGARGNKLDLA